jgi:hypothetical protein
LGTSEKAYLWAMPNQEKLPEEGVDEKQER